MPGIKWGSFFIVSAVSKTLVHFMPNTKLATAPYPVNCKFEVFGVGFPKKAVTVDGARLQQPDGLRVLDIVPELKGGFSGLLGFTLELNLPQAHVDLADSRCYVELISGSEIIRFEPIALKNQEALRSETILSLRNHMHSVMFINSGLLMQPLQVFKPDGVPYKMFSMTDRTLCPSDISLGPWSVIEYALNENDLAQLSHSLRYAKVTAAEISFKGNEDLAAFLITRDLSSRKILSVRPL